MGDLNRQLVDFRAAPGSETALALAMSLFAEGRARDALEVVKHRLKEHPEDLEGLLLVGAIHRLKGDMLRAQKALLQAARAHPTESRPYRGLGEVLLERNDPDRALRVLTKAARIAPTDMDIAGLLAKARRLQAAGGNNESGDAPAPVPARMQAPAPVPARAQAPAQVPARAPAQAPARVQAPAPVPPPAFRAPSDATKAPAGPFGESLSETDGFDADEPTVIAGADVQEALRHSSRPTPQTPSAQGAPPMPADGRPTPEVASAPLGLGASALDASVPKAPSAQAAPSDAPSVPVQPGAPPKAAAAPSAEASGAGDQDTDAVLAMLKAHGVFEEPGNAGDANPWVRDVAPEGTPVRTPMVALWIGVLLLVGGGFGGWHVWVGQQEATAVQLLDQAQTLVFRGEGDGSEASALIREALEHSPQNTEALRLGLLLQIQNTLEGGAMDAVGLRAALHRAEAHGFEGALMGAARRVAEASIGQGGLWEAPEVEGLAGAQLRYIAARLSLARAPEAAAAALAELSVTPDAETPEAAVVPLLARVDAMLVAGEPEAEALAVVEQALSLAPNHHRGELWKVYLTARTGDADALSASLAGLEEAMALPSERALHALATLRLAQRAEDAEGIAAAITAARQSGVEEPHWMARIAQVALDAGRLAAAEQAARAAARGTVVPAGYRYLLAEVLVARRQGRQALEVLAGLPGDAPRTLLAGAAAALLPSGHNARETIANGIEGLLEGESPPTGEPARELKAFALRLAIAQHDGSRRGGRRLLSQARRLSRANPGHPGSTQALLEAALSVRDAGLATETANRLLAAVPGSADAHYLLGRAQRMAADAEGAQGSFERAAELSPEHLEARFAAAFLNLDRGEFEAAQGQFEALKESPGRYRGRTAGVVARLGSIEALLGKTQWGEAEAAFEALAESQRQSSAGQVLLGRLRLGQGRAADALAAMRALADADALDGEAALIFGEALIAIGETAAARETFEAVLAEDRGSPEAHLALGELSLRAEDSRDAARSLETALESLGERIRPPALRARALILAGQIALEGGDKRQARERLQEAVALSGAPAAAHFWLGEALSGFNARDARAAYERYLELNPEGPFAARAQAAIR